MSEEELDSLPPVNGHDGGAAEAPGVFVGTSGKQPNFLQKLYEFMALEPHPCPEIIYWAADSKQLVIAQPDRLAKEILPRLFKHDKLSSFGRQLNIYGFSRMFPGRQFKDAEGHVSDASVWSHPTLTRMSTPAEVLNIKRRAAPKLYRTRRLANGQIVRTRAGPGVEAKFREVRDEMAESRRTRGLATTEDEHLQSSGRSYAFIQDDPEQIQSSHRGRSTLSPASSGYSGQSASLPHANAAPAFVGRPPVQTHTQSQPQYNVPKHFWNRERDYHNSHLESINEDAPSSWEIGFSGFIESAPVTANAAQVIPTGHDSSYRHATSFLHDNQNSPAQYAPPDSPLYDVSLQNTLPTSNQLSELHRLSIAVQSCPASIHTSPVLRARDAPHPSFYQPRMSWNPETPPSPFFNLNISQQSPSHAIQALQDFQNSQHRDQTITIAQPAAPNPFILSNTATPASGSSDSFAATMTAMSAASSPSSYESISPLHSARSSMIWEQSGIDPRLISQPGSVMTTPAATPRSGSPVNKPPAFSQFQVGGQY